MSKKTQGSNERPKDASFARSGVGVPDHSGSPIDVSDKEIDDARRKLLGEHGAAESTKREREHNRETPDGKS